MGTGKTIVIHLMNSLRCLWRLRDRCSNRVEIHVSQTSQVSSTTEALLCIAFIPQPPMLVYLFRLAKNVHGVRYAVLHVVLTAWGFILRAGLEFQAMSGKLQCHR